MSAELACLIRSSLSILSRHPGAPAWVLGSLSCARDLHEVGTACRVSRWRDLGMCWASDCADALPVNLNTLQTTPVDLVIVFK